MKTFIKNYMVLAKPLFRLCILGIFPVLAVLASLYCNWKWEFDIVGILVPVIAFVEIMADVWMFGGIYSKDAHMFELMKCSAKGRYMMVDSIRFDMVRRLLLFLITVGSCMWINGWGGNHIALVTGCVYVCTQLMLLVTRHWGLGRLQFLIAYFGSLLVEGVYLTMIVFTISRLAEKVMVAGVWILAIVITIVTDKYNHYRIEKSFYDEKIDNQYSE